MRNCMTALTVSMASQGLAAQAADTSVDRIRLASAQRDSGFASAKREPLDRALLNFWAATKIPSVSAEAWYDLGETKLRMWRLGVMPKGAAHQRMGERYLDAAASAMLNAAERESDGRGAMALGEMLLDPALQKYPLERLASGLARAFERQAALSRDPPFYIMWGRVESLTGNAERARRAFDHGCSVAGTGSVACLELARTMLEFGARGADSLYYASAASGDTATIALLRSDLALLADSAELARFDTLRGTQQRREYVEAFWARRDVADFRPAGSRLREHYARLAYAERNYRLVQWPRRYERWETYRPTDSRFDDRGVIYVRHGPPDTSVTYIEAAEGACYNATWAYRRPTGDMIFHFVARTDVDDWRIVEGIAYVSGGPGGRRVEECPAVEPYGLYASRIPIDPAFGRMAVAAASHAAVLGRLLEEDRRTSVRSMQRGTTTDSYAWRFSHQIHAVIQAYAMMGSADAEGTLLVVFAVPGAELASDTIANSERQVYKLRVRIEAVELTDGRHFEQDTVRGFITPKRLSDGELLTGTATLRVPPGDYRVGIVLSQAADRGEAVSMGRVSAYAGASTAPVLSDLIIGTLDGGLTWHNASGAVPLNARNAIEVGKTAELYYDVAGLIAGQRYGTTITIMPKKPANARSRARLRFEDIASSPFTSWRRSVGLGGIPVGTYLIIVEIDSRGVAVARREQTLNVVRAR